MINFIKHAVHLAAILLVAYLSEQSAGADTISIDDLTDTILVSVTTNEGAPITAGSLANPPALCNIESVGCLRFFSDSLSESFVHFRYTSPHLFTSPDPSVTTFLASRDMIRPGEDNIGFPSDRLLLTRTVGSGVLDITFYSDNPDRFNTLQRTNELPNVVENGEWQDMFIFVDPSNPSVVRNTIRVRSDVGPEEVPEPSIGILVGAALMGFVMYRNRPQRVG